MRNFWLALVSCLSLSVTLVYAATPEVGDQAPNITLESLTGEMVTLSDVTAEGPVVLLQLRGYPGYQCPVCSRQVHDFIDHGEEFAAAGARVLLVYPGPNENLKMRAEEFVQDKTLPDNFTLLLDPDFSFVNLYGLRWEAEGQTAYPSTFLIDTSGKIFFRKVGTAVADRTSAADMVEQLKAN